MAEEIDEYKSIIRLRKESANVFSFSSFDSLVLSLGFRFNTSSITLAAAARCPLPIVEAPSSLSLISLIERPLFSRESFHFSREILFQREREEERERERERGGVAFQVFLFVDLVNSKGVT